MPVSDVMQSFDWTTTMLILWALLGLIVYSVANIILIVNKKRQQTCEEAQSSSEDKTHCSDSAGDKIDKSVASQVLSEKPTTKWWTTQRSSGPDQQYNQWVDRVVEWLFTQDDSVTDSVLSVWINALNNKHRKLSNEVSCAKLTRSHPRIAE